MSSPVLVPVSVGELVDKITILAIKRERIADPSKLANVCREAEALEASWQEIAASLVDTTDLQSALKKVNERLWEIEDDIRTEEANKQFGARFIELARSVYRVNDERATLKRRINERVGSELQEEKSYVEH